MSGSRGDHSGQCLPVRVLRVPIAGSLMLRLASSGGSVRVRCINKEFRDGANHAHDGRTVTKVDEELVRPLRFKVILWVLSLPTPPIVESVLEVCGRQNALLLISRLSSLFPSTFDVSPLGFERRGNTEGMRAFSNLLAIARGAVAGGHALLLHWAFRRFLPGLRRRRPQIQEGLPWTEWISCALKKGHSEVHRVLVEALETGRTIFGRNRVIIPSRFFAPPEALRELSLSPLSKLEALNLSTVLCPDEDAFALTNLPVRPWLLSLKGDTDGIVAECPSGFRQAVASSFVSFSPFELNTRVAHFFSSLIDGAMCGGHEETVKKVFRFATDDIFSLGQITSVGLGAFCAGFWSSLRAPEIALKRGMWDLLEWLSAALNDLWERADQVFEGTSFVRGQLSSPVFYWDAAGCSNAICESSDKVKAFRWLVENGEIYRLNSEENFQFWLILLVTKCVDRSLFEFVVFSDHDSARSVRAKLPEDFHRRICAFARCQWKFDFLEQRLVDDAASFPFGGPPFVPVSLRRFAIQFLCVAESEPLREFPSLPEGTEADLKQYLMETLEEGLNLDHFERLFVSPVDMLKIRNFPAFRFLLSVVGDGGSQRVCDSLAGAAPLPSRTRGEIVDGFLRDAWCRWAPFDSSGHMLSNEYDQCLVSVGLKKGFDVWEKRLQFEMEGFAGFFRWAVENNLGGPHLRADFRRSLLVLQPPGGLQSIARAWSDTMQAPFVKFFWGEGVHGQENVPVV
uniref:Uncharacterized protein n=1 Tax=Chromera velia CCMP2878 TaxID=1169474 RepID=A0A0G4HSS8_9ALVE|eukprot:Cvel_8350.t1-p1 / transcript=Cvel_8350.t1 / gene=Cvel_8350 / organism=Chromera_velia_CCMP2878 / gene_product=hypothetical protein / transcript_product=hypothetical protein / location=Cvel_scaffold459:84491-86704(-) / protein_length=738 / sequence_SO=supercontig / SO=protein_coding / is_pseudo=false